MRNFLMYRVYVSMHVYVKQCLIQQEVTEAMNTSG